MNKFNKKLEKKLKKQTENRIEKGLMDLPSPDKLKNCVSAAKKIVSYLLEGKRMLLVGDYDADGIMATTIMIDFLNKAGFGKLVDYKIPSRLEDGYGLSPNIINYAKENLFDFIVTVDNGIAALEAIELSNSYGIPVIITDHHTAPKILPNAEIIVNPKQPGETFPFKEISGATVAWYVVAALRAELNVPIDIRQWIDYVCITVISDVMPLDNINLAFLSYGLKKIKERKRYIYQLIWDEYSAPTIDTTSLSFALVPMINAIGRIDDANKGVQLFLSKKQLEILPFFEEVKAINEKRKNLSLSSTNMAIESIKDNDSKVIIVRNKDWHEGIVGIIAGRLAEKYQKPAYAFTYNEKKGIWKGSGRSAGNIHLYDLTNKVSNLTAGFGGHKGAVGLGVKDNLFEEFSSKLTKEATKIPEEEFVDESTIPLECSLSDIDFDTIKVLEKYGPYGQGNPAPIFLTKKVEILVEREMKGGLHFKCKLQNKEASLTGLFFNVNKEDFLKKVEEKDKVDIVFYPSLKFNQKKDSMFFELICTLL
jgi:single-stranded-DNA-specific exonuclease